MMSTLDPHRPDKTTIERTGIVPWLTLGLGLLIMAGAWLVAWMRQPMKRGTLQ